MDKPLKSWRGVVVKKPRSKARFYINYYKLLSLGFREPVIQHSQGVPTAKL